MGTTHVSEKLYEKCFTLRDYFSNAGNRLVWKQQEFKEKSIILRAVAMVVLRSAEHVAIWPSLMKLCLVLLISFESAGFSTEALL